MRPVTQPGTQVKVKLTITVPVSFPVVEEPPLAIKQAFAKAFVETALAYFAVNSLEDDHARWYLNRGLAVALGEADENEAEVPASMVGLLVDGEAEFDVEVVS